MQKHKKVLSLILAMVLALSCFSCLGSVSAFAAETQQLQIGDANADGVIDIDDVTFIQLYLADRLNKAEITDAQIWAMDVTGDDDVTVDDVTLLQLYLAGRGTLATKDQPVSTPTEPTEPTDAPESTPTEPTEPTAAPESTPTEPTEPTAAPVTTPDEQPTTEPAAEKEYSIAGSSEDIFGASWDASNTATDMTKGEDGKYSITFTDVQPANNIELKVVTDHDWAESYGDASGANVKFNVKEACDVVTFDPETKQITVTGDGVTVDVELIVDKVRAVGNGQDNWLNDSNWDPNDDANLMSEVAEGIYEITFEDVDEDLNYQIKFAVNGGWANNFGAPEEDFVCTSGEQFDAAYNGKNIYVHVDESGSTVKAQLDLRDFVYATRQGAKVTITVTPPESVEPSTPDEQPTEAPTEAPVTTPDEPTEPAAEKEYSIAGSSEDIFGASWDASNTATDMTKGEDGKYSITFTDVQPALGRELRRRFRR